MKTKPRVFIIESLNFSDEEHDLFEGKIISPMLALRGCLSKYVYLRTKRELEEVMGQFEKSAYRYLHFSCHGNKNGIVLALDEMPFDRLGEMLAPRLKNKRVFFSSCEVMNEGLA